jgi:hypothetical protein
MTETVLPTMEERQAQWLDDLHEMVLYMHGHPEAVPAFGSCQATLIADSAEDMADQARAIGGKWETGSNDTYFHLVKHFGRHGLVISLQLDRLGTVAIPDFLLALAEPSPSEIVPPTDDDDIEPF